MPRGIDPRDRADRDDPRGVRDGRDPVRAARPRGGPQRGSLGLHLQHHQEVPDAARHGPARPRAGHDDRAVHARLHRAAGADLPPTRRARDRRHGGFIPSRRDPEVNETALARVREDKEREAGDGFDGTWVAHPDLVPRRDARSSTASSARGRTRRTACAPEVASTAADLLDVRVPGGGVTEAGVRPNVASALPLSRLVAARQRRGGDQQPDGGRRDGRDQPLAALAVADARRSPSTTAQPLTADRYATIRDEELATLRSALPRLPGTDAAALLDDLVLADDFAEFLTLAAYRRLG